jgi:hypothetical protein
VVVSYFQVAESKVAVSQVIVGPFSVRSELLPGCAVPGHGVLPFKVWRRSVFGFLRVGRQELQVLEGFAGVPGHLDPPGTQVFPNVKGAIYPKISRESQVILPLLTQLMFASVLSR